MRHSRGCLRYALLMTKGFQTIRWFASSFNNNLSPHNSSSAVCASRSSAAARSTILLFGRSGSRSLHGNSQLYQRRPKSCTATTGQHIADHAGVIHTRQPRLLRLRRPADRPYLHRPEERRQRPAFPGEPYCGPPAASIWARTAVRSGMTAVMSGSWAKWA